MFKVNNKDTKIVNLEYISHLVLVCILLNLSRKILAGIVGGRQFSPKYPFAFFPSQDNDGRNLISDRHLINICRILA